MIYKNQHIFEFIKTILSNKPLFEGELMKCLFISMYEFIIIDEKIP
jgi:hypothetical protein